MKRKFFKRRKYQNPFLPKRSQDDLIKKKKRKRILLGLLIIILLLGGVYVFIYSPVFKIRKVVISGTGETKLINELQIIAQEQTRGYRYFVLPKDNILFINRENLRDKINSLLILDKLEINKRLLHTLEIEAKEKIPVLLWNEGGEFYYIDKDGIVMAAVPYQEIKYDLSLLNRGTTTQIIINQKVIESDNINFINQVLAQVKDKFNQWTVNQVVAKRVQNEEIYFYTNEGWYFVLDTQADIGRSLDDLAALLDQKIEDRSKLEYVDLRIEDRIFYKEY